MSKLVCSVAEALEGGEGGAIRKSTTKESYQLLILP